MTVTETCAPPRRTPPEPGGAAGSVGDGRYRLAAAGTGLLPALDTRLGREVLVRRGGGPAADTARRLLGVGHPLLAPLLDAGDDEVGGVRTAFAVYPATDLPTFADVPVSTWAQLPLPVVAATAAWLVAGAAAVQRTGATSVALCADAVVVDVEALGDPLTCGLRWMPSFAAERSDLAAVVGALVAGRGRRGRRPLAGVVDLLPTPHGRLRAARQLADTAGLDPRLFGLLPRAPHHAGPERRRFGRRSIVGTVPTSQREEVPCVSVEACS